MAETAFSAIKGRFGFAANPHAWYHEVSRTRINCRSLQPRTSTQTVIPTPSSDSTMKGELSDLAALFRRLSFQE